MTALIATEPEPAGDVYSQFRAYFDSSHPKRAIWLSAGTWVPMSPAILDITWLTTPVGRLYAAPRLLRRLKADPSLETLASILDYDEAKPPIVTSWLPVVQAVTVDGWVVQEMLSSWSRIGEARRRAAAYGAVRVLSMAACIARRRRLIGEEAPYIENARPRVGTGARISQCPN